MRKIKTAVIGSCVTRDIFNSKFIRNYKDFYDCVCTVWQTSMISFMSKKAIVDEEKRIFTEEVTKLQKNTALRDMDKTYREDLKESQPDYIIFDLYTDVKYGIVRTENGYLTNNPNGFRKTVYYKDNHFKQSLDIFKNEEYLELLIDSFGKFLDWVKKNIPNCKILITQFNETFSYMTKEGYPVNYNNKICSTVAKDNEMYSKLYSKLSENKNVRFLNMLSKTYFADFNHPYGNKPWHFTQQYYEDLFARFNEIVLIDELKKNNHNADGLVSQVMKKFFTK